jgi:hypothetical protein
VAALAGAAPANDETGAAAPPGVGIVERSHSSALSVIANADRCCFARGPPAV